MLYFIRAIVSEFIGKVGIDHAFSKKHKSALLMAYISTTLFKGNRRGSLLLSYLYLNSNKKEKAIKEFNNYDKRYPLLKTLASSAEKYKGSNKFLVPRIYSLTKTWSKKPHAPRQIQFLDKKEFLLNKGFNIHTHEYKGANVLHIIAEDHEWSITPGKSEGNNYLTLREAKIQLVEKGRVINEICQEAKVPWSHLIDYGSYLMIKKAGLLFPETWGRLLNDFHSFFLETIKTGNDLGIHVHPDKSYLAAECIEKDRIFIKNDHLKTWGEIDEVGSIDDPVSKIGMVMGCKNLLEMYARKIDPNFRAIFFRAGSYSMGLTKEQTKNSVDLLLKCGISVSSDALLMDGITESIGRLSDDCVYIAKHSSPWEKEDSHSKELFIQALPLRTKYLARYSVMDMARLYSKSANVLQDTINEARKGQGYIISVDHDIDIGFSKFGGDWDSLDRKSGDLKLLKNYIVALSKQQNVKCIKASEFVEHLETKNQCKLN
jgi:hypothetical protein